MKRLAWPVLALFFAPALQAQRADHQFKSDYVACSSKAEAAQIMSCANAALEALKARQIPVQVLVPAQTVTTGGVDTPIVFKEVRAGEYQAVARKIGKWQVIGHADAKLHSCAAIDESIDLSNLYAASFAGLVMTGDKETMVITLDLYKDVIVSPQSPIPYQTDEVRWRKKGEKNFKHS